MPALLFIDPCATCVATYKTFLLGQHTTAVHLQILPAAATAISHHKLQWSVQWCFSVGTSVEVHTGVRMLTH